MNRNLLFFLLCTLFLNVSSQSLMHEFAQPPQQFQPWIFWFWMNGNVSKKGLTADLEAFHKQNISGIMLFDVDHGTPRGSVRFMSSEWYDLLKHTCAEASRLGLEIAYHNAPGWAGTGGPWVTHDKAMQKLVWSEIHTDNKEESIHTLPLPPAIRGYYRDIMAVAFPTPDYDTSILTTIDPDIRIQETLKIKSNVLNDNNIKTGLSLPIPIKNKASKIEISFEEPHPARMLTFTLGWKAWPLVEITGWIEISLDGKHFNKIDNFKAVPPQLNFQFKETSIKVIRLYFDKIVRQDAALDSIRINEMEISPSRIDNFLLKGLYKASANNIPMSASHNGISDKYCVNSSSVIQLVPFLIEDNFQYLSGNEKRYRIPAGKWTILRIGHTITDSWQHPAPTGGIGFECNKLSKEALDDHMKEYVDKIINHVKPYVGKTFKYIHTDSWEAGAQNWTEGMIDSFKLRRDYDPVPYFVALTGRIVDNIEITERFLWDYRKTISEMMLENYAGYYAKLAHARGMQFSAEAYDKGITDEIVYGGTTDFPVAEFWSWPKLDFSYSCTEMVSAAHIYGKSIIGAEAFTASALERWQSHPATVKDIADWAFCEGINRMILTKSTHQPWLNLSPGLVMGPWGLHYERTTTWWDYTLPWHQYLSRCQYLLQKGIPVADICYLTPEIYPNKWHVPTPRDKAWYQSDGCPTDAFLKLAFVKDGRICFPQGMSYSILAINTETMSVEVLRKIKQLIAEGAMVVGEPPIKSLGLKNISQNDTEIALISKEIWKDCDGKKRKISSYGNGKVIRGLSPEHALQQIGIERDFHSDVFIRYTHRRVNDTDIYFVANPTNQKIAATCTFRITDKKPEIWYPETGRTKDALFYSENIAGITIPLPFKPFESYFIVFEPSSGKDNYYVKTTLNGKKWQLEFDQHSEGDTYFMTEKAGIYSFTDKMGFSKNFSVDAVKPSSFVPGPWSVFFEPGKGAPDLINLDSLISWTDHADSGVRYFSGTGIYKNSFLLNEKNEDEQIILDLGRVEIMAEVIINGSNMGILWKEPFTVDISDAVITGTNRIEIRVVNLPVNRMVGDENIPEICERTTNAGGWYPAGQVTKWPEWLLQGKSASPGRYTFSTWNLWHKDEPLKSSGLMGPVVVKFKRKIAIR